MYGMLISDRGHDVNKSAGGLVGYDDWFTPSRSGVRFPPGVYFALCYVSTLSHEILQSQHAFGERDNRGLLIHSYFSHCQNLSRLHVHIFACMMMWVRSLFLLFVTLPY